MQLVLQVHARREPSVLNRVLAVLHRRGFNIETMTLGNSEDTRVLRMMIVVDVDERGATRLEANLSNLIDVLQVQIMVESSSIFREMALVRVVSTAETNAEILRVANVFHSRVLETAVDFMVLEVTGGKDKVDAFLATLQRFRILDFARTNRLAIPRTRTSGPPVLPCV
jgi:acetolactate synthase-1/3 small subunit